MRMMSVSAEAMVMFLLGPPNPSINLVGRPSLSDVLSDPSSEQLQCLV